MNGDAHDCKWYVDGVTDSHSCIVVVDVVVGVWAGQHHGLKSL